MAKQPIPDHPKLFRDYKGRYAIHYPSWRVNGARTLGSHLLKTTDKQDAINQMKIWVDSGEYQKAADEAKARMEAHQRGEKVPLKSVRHPGSVKHKLAVSKGGEKRKYTKKVNGAAQSSVAQARQIMSVVTAQLHALALNMQMLSATLGMSDDE